ncbi:hypothetical protein NDU88_002939 [Pleurodeles waltl]|uniref:Uncharacterized protein n=1 Tax=Pleurodeles waltl TaxID=8319 RepID=A0AAV7MR32_PLEWA|nr:hypothetical protein NDU88_002939 [Pleurodeles waltl]
MTCTSLGISLLLWLLINDDEVPGSLELGRLQGEEPTQAATSAHHQGRLAHHTLFPGPHQPATCCLFEAPEDIQDVQQQLQQEVVLTYTDRQSDLIGKAGLLSDSPWVILEDAVF